MRLTEKTVKFINQEGKEPTFEQTRDLKLVVDGKITETLASELFFPKHSVNAGYIKGYSVLEQTEQTSPEVYDKLIISDKMEPLVIGFVDPESGTMFHIKSIEIPFMNYSDDFPDEDITTFLQKFYSSSAPEPASDESDSDRGSDKEAPASTEDTPEDEKAESHTSPHVDEAEASDGGSSPTPLDSIKEEMSEAGYAHQQVEGSDHLLYEVFTKEKRVPSVFFVGEDNKVDEVLVEDTGLYVSEDGLTVMADPPSAEADSGKESEEPVDAPDIPVTNDSGEEEEKPESASTEVDSDKEDKVEEEKVEETASEDKTEEEKPEQVEQ